MTVQQLSDGSKTLYEWLGEGSHPDPQAQDRADVCSGRITGNPCPYNYQGHWLIPETIANLIKQYAEAKNHLKLTVRGEETLGWCEVCSCKLSLKVHVPLKHIVNHCHPETLEKFPAFCWMTTERICP
jgi:hypothetical protein